MYPDAPLKLGRSPDSYVSYEIGFYYCVCRMMEILASHAGDLEITQKASHQATHLETAYLEAFFDQDKGFLADALVGPDSQPNGTYPRYALFPMHNSFGAWLLRPVMDRLSQFIQKELLKPDGIRMVPDWDAHIDTETVTSACWFLHFDLYCLKVFRRAGDAKAILEWLKLANDYFGQRQVIPELQMLDSSGQAKRTWEGPVGQIWQFFALSGWSRGLLEGVVGLESDIGGLTYIPCDLDMEIELRDFLFRDGSWNLDISGKGKWIGNLSVDQQPIAGSYKLPLKCYTPGNHQLKIVRTEVAPKTPILLEAVGAGINSLQLNKNRLTANLVANNEVNIIFYTPFRPEVNLNGKPMEANWDSKCGLGSTSFALNEEGELAIVAINESIPE